MSKSNILVNYQNVIFTFFVRKEDYTLGLNIKLINIGG